MIFTCHFFTIFLKVFRRELGGEKKTRLVDHGAHWEEEV